MGSVSESWRTVSLGELGDEAARPTPLICGSGPALLFFLKKYLFIYLFLAVLGLRFCARAFSSCGKRGPQIGRAHV